jgi:cobalt-zinc-cadmium resistance protein CzcA
MQISRDNTQRRTYVGINVAGRDIKSLVDEIESTLDAKLTLPPGFYIRYGGAFENLERATKRLSLVVPLALALIFILVFFAVKSFKQTLMIYIAVPFAAVGGIFSLYLRGMPFSISAGVGFIVLFGVAVLNGLVLISGFNELKAEGKMSINDIIVKGSIRRIRPILLTASTDILGFLPMAVSMSAGAEVQRPLATVVIGGMLTSTLLTLIVLPVLYRWVEGGDISEDTAKREGETIPSGPSAIQTSNFNAMTFTEKIKLKISEFLPSRAGKVFGSAFLLAFILLPGGVFAQSQTLTLEQAVARAKENYPAIKAAQLEVERQKALKVTAVDLGTTSVYTGKEEVGNGEKGINNKIGFNQNEIDLLGIPAKSKLAKARTESAGLGLELTEASVIRDVRTAWYRAVFAKEQWLLYRRLDTVYTGFKKAAELRFKTQQTSKIEYLSANTKYQELKIGIKTAEGDYRAALEMLNRYLLFDSPFDVDTEIPQNDMFSVAALSDTLHNNPELIYYNSLIGVSKAEWKAERSAFLPKFDAGYVNQSVDGVNGYHGWQAGVSVPLLFFSQSGKTKASKINFEIANKQYEQKAAEVNARYRQLLSRYLILKDVTEYYRENALPLADEQMEASKLAYRLGSIDYVQFIQNIESAIRIKQEYLIRKNEYLNLSAQLKYLVGE